MIESTTEPKTVRFPHAAQKSFSKELRKRINQYFKDNGISNKGNTRMFGKTLVMLAMYFGPYLVMITAEPNIISTIGLFFIMGLGMSGIGMSVMHDAVHGAYHKNKWINKIMGSSIYLISGNATTWFFQHNVLHHTYTNIEGLDEDLETKGLIRLHPSQPWKKMHEKQAFYAPFLYGILTLNWVTLKDFGQLIRYQKMGLAKFTKAQKRQKWATLIFTKMLYFTLFVAMPLLIVPVSWYWIMLGFVIMHFTAGFILSFVFQLAHLVDHVENYDMPVSGKMDDAWMEHQMRTTSNFARKSWWVGWYVGGLNFQVEHHLFPNICHIHYPKISEIVKKTAQEFKIPYNEHKTLGEAINAHMNSLRMYAKQPVLA
jgi:linoleoyl-CoA desaturase